MVFSLGIILAAFGITLLELSEAGAVAMIYQAAYRNLKPIGYAVAGVTTVMVPTFVLGSYISLIPLDYVLFAASFILFYFAYKLLRSARRGFRRIKKGQEDEKIEGLAVVYTVSVTESVEAALVIISLMPRSYSSSLLGFSAAAVAVIGLAAALRSQIMRIRLPHLKLVLSALLFSLGTVWLAEVFTNVTDLLIPLLFLAYLGISYVVATRL